MTYPEIIAGLRKLKVETGSLACLGCGQEHGCSIHGCAIIRAAEEMCREIEHIRQTSISHEAHAALMAEKDAEIERLSKERDAAVADIKILADTYRETVGDDGICGLCKQDSDHGLDGDANECAGFYKDDCFVWRGPKGSNP